jgi:hypothetical protein
MGLFGLGNGAFDNYMIDLSLIVYALSLGIKIGVRTSGDCEDCVMGGDSVGLLWRALGFVVEVVAEGWLRS